jgi:uncharacterized protein
MKTKEEITLWRMLRRISNQIKVQLDDKKLDYANHITYVNLENLDLDIQIDHLENTLIITNSSSINSLDIKLLATSPSFVFKQILRMVEDKKY